MGVFTVISYLAGFAAFLLVGVPVALALGLASLVYLLPLIPI